MSYTISLQNLRSTYPELEPLYRAHYGEMERRLVGDGVEVSPYAPRLDEYFRANEGGWLLHYVARHEGAAVGYSNIYLTRDMHNGDLIAQEDTIYVTPAHRNGLGRKMVKHILADLKQREVRRVNITPVTDLRVSKIWQRMGFKPVAEVLTYTF